ncbi:MAG TPA: hypothetical protein VHA12_03130 [Candidatus Nanoarchaeia archaeon]|nr:hypothetical protein [Candidatus Nanoarchaeia archaeon]
MKATDILIVKKMTKIEWDMRRLNLDKVELKKFYEKEGLNSEVIFSSHMRQYEYLDELIKLLQGATIIDRDSINKEIVKKFKLIIAFGGDNHFQHVSHYIDEQLMLGINSDPLRSVGALCSVKSPDIRGVVNEILEEKFNVESWTRTKIVVDGVEVWPHSTSDVFIGEEKRYVMSRHIIHKEGISEEQKGSGLIISTGAGSTGWYCSASRYLKLDKHNFTATDKEIWFLLAEPYEWTGHNYKLKTGKIKNKETLEVTSLSDSQAVLSIDSLVVVKLREGAKVKIQIGEPLKIIKIK